MTAYYNEIDPFAAAWLRELIKAGLIAPGEVDERSIEQVEPADLRGFRQCHFFAGIGVWSYALRAAGWPDDSAVWTGSCPCQGFSASGKRGGFSDQRHLWPAWFRLVRECRPRTVFGEQVSSKDGLAWFDVVSADLEDAGYAIGALDICAAGVGAPHIRQRLYFVARADAMRERDRTEAGFRDSDGSAYGAGQEVGIRASYDVGALRAGERADAAGSERRPTAQGGADDTDGANAGRRQADGGLGVYSEAGNALHADNGGLQVRRTEGSTGVARRDRRGQAGPHLGTEAPQSGADVSLNPEQPRLEGHGGDVREWRGPGWLDPHTARSVTAAGATGGFWSDCDWWYGRDGKYRPIESGVFPLAAKSPARVGRLRGYGNAIVAAQAKEFIKAAIEVMGEPHLQIDCGEAGADAGARVLSLLP